MMKNVLVTGCSRGIGFETVKNFAIRQNITVLAVARSKDGLNRLPSEANTFTA